MRWWCCPLKTNFFFFACVVLIWAEAVSGASCTSATSPVVRSSCEREWTVLVYMNGDNDLSSFTFDDINAMEEVGSSQTVDVVVQQDTIATDGIVRYHVQKENVPSPKIVSARFSVLPERDSGHLQTLVDFLAFGVKNFPSKHYLVIIWSHGEGYLGGISLDFTSRSRLGINDLHTALEYLQYAHLGGKKIDIYASDACLMQSLEVIYELREQARYIVGSANREKKTGWNYADILKFLVNDSSQKLQQQNAGNDAPFWLALEIPHLYLKHYFHTDPFATLNAVATAEIARTDRQSLWHSLSLLATAMQEFIAHDPFLNPLHVLAAVHKSYEYAPAKRDLKSFLGHLRANPALTPDLKLAIDEVLFALAKIVLRPATDDPKRGARYYHGKEFGYGVFSAGLTLWLPSTKEQFLQTEVVFKKTALIMETGWYETQKALFANF